MILSLVTLASLEASPNQILHLVCGGSAPELCREPDGSHQ